MDVSDDNFLGNGRGAPASFKLAALTSGERLFADVVREVALVVVGAIPALGARQALADAFVLIAEIRGRAGVQPAGNLRP